ncbi:hypothetical protein KDA_75540 [Dictyobacter alpinus]|uniref:Uncharacterized protein n=1 Tax=Dictyobacter alpinus TaxID=2014873 RepID=A0A402BL82_9CHLR|nr:FxSxx-COOH system tetratricopeptide repeat protein [Dictyobacter alpinus]GCE32070.1 hypothetical protein KDA_75540 [Dictyobacter alpinus]
MTSATEKRPKHPNNITRFLRGKPIAQVARELKIAERTFRGWVLGEVRVPQHYVEQLTEYFGCSEVQLLTKRVVPAGNMPYQRNALFTGRDELLRQLHHALNKNALVALTQPQALCGLGGIGKTQTVIEYAYRYCNDYDVVFWIKTDTRENVLSDMLHIATLLELPERSAQDSSLIVAALKKWLQTHKDWLLIFDNADDLTFVRDALPATYEGHVLLTTRAQAMGRLAHRLDVEEMSEEIGALFILRRSGRISSEGGMDDASEVDRLAARDLVRELGGLPLALDQAGAYMEESSCSITEYLQLYRKESLALLARRGGIVNDHPAPVSTTWSISFTEVESLQPAAADLLRVCAFLDPDAIPEELVVEGAGELGPRLVSVAANPLLLHQAIASLWKYSLIRRTVDAKMLSLHRLVQLVQKETMDAAERKTWAERVVRAVHRVFPARIDVSSWHVCQRLLAQAQVCALLIEQEQFTFAEAAQLLNQAAYYLRERARYSEAEELYRKALEIREQLVGPLHLDVAQSNYNLARLYFDIARYEEAEALYRRALEIRRHLLGPDHILVAQTLNSQALTLWGGGTQYEYAEQLYAQALEIFDRTVGHEHQLTAHAMNNLALLYETLERKEEAEQLHLQVLAIRERLLPGVHLDTAQSLQNLAYIYVSLQKREKYPDAERLFFRSLEIREQLLGPDHPQTARSLNNLALLYEAQDRYEEAKPLYQRALEIREKALGSENQKTKVTRAAYEALLQRLEQTSST